MDNQDASTAVRSQYVQSRAQELSLAATRRTIQQTIENLRAYLGRIEQDGSRAVGSSEALRGIAESLGIDVSDASFGQALADAANNATVDHKKGLWDLILPLRDFIQGGTFTPNAPTAPRPEPTGRKRPEPSDGVTTTEPRHKTPAEAMEPPATGDGVEGPQEPQEPTEPQGDAEATQPSKPRLRPVEGPQEPTEPQEPDSGKAEPAPSPEK